MARRCCQRLMREARRTLLFTVNSLGQVTVKNQRLCWTKFTELNDLCERVRPLASQNTVTSFNTSSINENGYVRLETVRSRECLIQQALLRHLLFAGPHARHWQKEYDQESPRQLPLAWFWRTGWGNNFSFWLCPDPSTQSAGELWTRAYQTSPRLSEEGP